MTGLINGGYLDKLPGQHFYAGTVGRASAIYRLTSKGAAYLRQEGESDVRASGLTEPEAIGHALAMLDCRLMLNLRRDGQAITDKQIVYGPSVIRPDNLFRFKDDRSLPVLVESEALAKYKRSLLRIRRKVANWTDFFLSAEGNLYDNAVRLIYLWPPSDHARALSLWEEACRRERASRNLEALPFSVHFFPHYRFTEYAQLETRLYSSLPEVVVQRSSKGDGEETEVVAEGGTLPGPTDGFDEDTLDFLHCLHAYLKEGITTWQQLQVVLKLIDDYLVTRPRLREILGTCLDTLLSSGSPVTERHAMEAVAMTFFDHLYVPYLATDGEALTPISLYATGIYPGLTVKVSDKHAATLLRGWLEDSDALAWTLQKLFLLLFNHGRTVIKTEDKK